MPINPPTLIVTAPAAVQPALLGLDPLPVCTQLTQRALVQMNCWFMQEVMKFLFFASSITGQKPNYWKIID